MKKILFLSHMFPLSKNSNFGIFVYNQVKELVKHNFDVIVVCPVPWFPRNFPIKNNNWSERLNLPFVTEYEGIKVYYPRGLTIPKYLVNFRGRSYYYSLRKFFKNLFNDYQFDLIHCHSALPDADLARQLKKKFNIPLVCTLHGHDLQVLASNSKLYKNRIIRVLSHCDSIGLVSEKLKNLLNNIAGDVLNDDKVRVIYNGIQVYNEYEDVSRKLPKNKIILITIAALIKQKGIITVLHVLAKLVKEFPDLHYIVIGDGWDRKLISQVISDLNLSAYVELLGALSHKLSMSYLKESDIMIMPSLNESFGIVYIESMYFKKITIGSINEGISEIIKDGENGFLVAPDDENMIYELLKKILLNFNDMQKVQHSGHHTVWPIFSWENNIKCYIELYEELLK